MTTSEHFQKLWLREKVRDLTLSYDKNPYAYRKFQKADCGLTYDGQLELQQSPNWYG